MSKLSLLRCVLCLNPTNSFAAFEVNKLLRMNKFYPNKKKRATRSKFYPNDLQIFDLT